MKSFRRSFTVHRARFAENPPPMHPMSRVERSSAFVTVRRMTGGSMLEFLQSRTIAGIETVEGNTYKRVVEIGGKRGSIEVTHVASNDTLSVTIRFPSVGALQEVVSRVRRLFDLGADIETIDKHLSLDKALRPLIVERPGLRTPGEWDRRSEPDAFPAAPNARLLRGAAKVLGGPVTPKSLVLRAEAWRPWRAYAAQHLWAAGAVPPPERKPRLTTSVSRKRGAHHELVL